MKPHTYFILYTPRLEGQDGDMSGPWHSTREARDNITWERLEDTTVTIIDETFQTIETIDTLPGE